MVEDRLGRAINSWRVTSRETSSPICFISFSCSSSLGFSEEAMVINALHGVTIVMKLVGKVETKKLVKFWALRCT